MASTAVLAIYRGKSRASTVRTLWELAEAHPEHRGELLAVASAVDSKTLDIESCPVGQQGGGA